MKSPHCSSLQFNYSQVGQTIFLRLHLSHNGLEMGLHSRSMNLVVLKWVTMTIFFENKTLFVERIRSFSANWIGVWHILQGITLWPNWIECNDKGFNQFQWHGSKINYVIWVTYAKAAWARVLRYIEIRPFSAKALLKGFDQSYGSCGGALYAGHLVVEWNWKIWWHEVVSSSVSWLQ